MRCWNCGEIIDDDSVFCTECGADQREGPEESLQQAEPECPRCGSPLQPGADRCHVCGYVFQKKKKNTALLVAIPVGAVALLAAVGIVAGTVLLKKKDPGNDVSQAGSFGTVQGTVQQSAAGAGQSGGPVGQVTAQTAAPVRQETEDPNFWAGAVDAVNNSSIDLTGTVEEAGGGWFLNLEVPATVCANDESGQKQRMEGISRIKLCQGSQGLLLSGHNGDVVTVSGPFLLRGQMPELTVYGMNVIQAASREEDIHEYRIQIEDCTWEEAFTRCRSMGGYLVRFNSLAEFNYVTQMIDASGIEKVQFYIGMRRDPGADSYYLVDENNVLMGTRLDSGYTDWLNPIWLDGEPSYRDSVLNIEESYGSMFRYGDPRRWVVNDVPNDLIAALETNKGKIGYICEIAD